MKIHKKLKYFILPIALCLTIVGTMNTTPIYANTIDNTNIATPNWWPGNPNPQPGTEDWFFQNPSYGTNAPDAVARRCGQEAIFDALVPAAAEEAFVMWFAKKAFDIGTFGLSFVANMTYNYAMCLWRSGVR